MVRDVRREITLARCLVTRLEAIEHMRIAQSRPHGASSDEEYSRAAELADAARAELALHWATVGEHV